VSEREAPGHAGMPQHGSAQHSLAEFFAPGVEPHDVLPLFPLLGARPYIAALIAMFRGGDDEVLVRLLVLREIGLRPDAPEWTPQELNAHFSYIAPAKFGTVINRLREHELLQWDADRRIYQISSAGRMVLSALSTLLGFGEEQDGELGFLAAQIAASASVGKVSSEALTHLLARLAELEEEFSQAVASGSEFRLRAAQARLGSVRKWMDKANEVMRDLAADGLDESTWRLAQQIGQRQSRLMRMSSVFQRELAAIARQQVHLSQGGLTSSELAAWLLQRSLEELAALAGDSLALTPESTFILPDVMLDNAEEFVEREQPNRRISTLPPPAAVEHAADVQRDPPRYLGELTRLLQALPEPMPVADAVIGGNFAAASYRLSLLAFINEQNVDPELAPLAALPLRLDWDEGRTSLAPVNRNEVAAMSPGSLVPIEEKNP
jgi:hypothetical protein